MAASLLARGVLSGQFRVVPQSFMCLGPRWLSSGEKGSDTIPSGETSTSSDNGMQSSSTVNPSPNDPVIDNLVTESPSQNKPKTTIKTNLSPTEGAIDKFGKVIEKVKKLQETTEAESVSLEDPNESFASMFRRSKFVSLGEPKGRLVRGRIIEVMDNDLYIDFGGKFHCVCPRPVHNPERYHRGANVTVSLQAPEMSSAFLGSDIHVTLLEADGILLGLTGPSKSSPRSTSSKTSAKS